MNTELEVPGEPGVYWCARHRKVKTRLRCGRCETPICPKCTRMGPTGARCPDCASHRTSHMYQVGAGHYLVAFVASLVLGAIGASLVEMAGFFILFFASAAGPVLGKVVVFITRGKRGPVLAGVVSAGLVIGALLASSMPLLLALLAAHPPGTPIIPLAHLLLASFGNIWLWIFIAIAVPGVWWWLK